MNQSLISKWYYTYVYLGQMLGSKESKPHKKYSTQNLSYWHLLLFFKGIILFCSVIFESFCPSRPPTFIKMLLLKMTTFFGKRQCQRPLGNAEILYTACLCRHWHLYSIKAVWWIIVICRTSGNAISAFSSPNLTKLYQLMRNSY
jgi:hypothetical protein